jgi:hypothetical protein
LEDLDIQVEINSVWETIRENIQISTKESLGYFELNNCKPMVRQRMFKIQNKLQLLQDPSEINGDNLNNVRREVSRYFRGRKRGNI